jgi:hypothetical protein
MATVAEHYAKHLAPIYLWMAGGADAAFAAGEADLRELRGSPGLAIDLGAGFGMHAIPLGRVGFQVLAIDSSELLLRELRSLCSGLPVEAHCADLLKFPSYLTAGQQAVLIVCMGDTLTHLPNLDAVQTLANQVATFLAPFGRFVATFRDYTRLPAAEARFIPVRSDDSRILTCFLEEHPNFVQVHDILHERASGAWVTTVSSYRKLRLEPSQACDLFAAAGLKPRVEPGPRGMFQLIAEA